MLKLKELIIINIRIMNSGGGRGKGCGWMNVSDGGKVLLLYLGSVNLIIIYKPYSWFVWFSVFVF